MRTLGLIVVGGFLIAILHRACGIDLPVSTSFIVAVPYMVHGALLGLSVWFDLEKR